MARVVKVELSNRSAKFAADYDDMIDLKRFFSYRDPSSMFTPRYRAGLWDGYRSLMQYGTTGAGLFLDMKDRLERQEGFRFRVTDKSLPPEFYDLDRKGTIAGARDYQKACLTEMIRYSNHGGIIVCATGTGKTFMAGMYFHALIGPACFVVDELTLMEQAREELQGMLGEKIGIIGNQQYNPQRITTATVQTLHRHRDMPEFKRWMQSLDAMVIDEIHVQLNRRNIDVVHVAKPKAVFGLTATLELDKEDVRMRATALAGIPIFSYGIDAGMDSGVLSKGVVCRVLFPNPGNGEKRWIPDSLPFAQRQALLLKRSQQDYHRLIVLSGARNTCVERLARAGVKRGRRVIVLTERLQHLQLLHERLIDVPHTVLDGSRKETIRTAAKKAMETGDVNLILASRIFAKGINIKRCDTIIDAAAMPNRNGSIQKFGRGIRAVAGKDGLIYLDIQDTGMARFQRSAQSRIRALRELQVPIASVPWEGKSTKVYETALAMLKGGIDIDRKV